MSENMKYCHNCGKKLDAGLICEACGLEFREEKEETTTEESIAEIYEKLDAQIRELEGNITKKIDLVLAEQRKTPFVEKVAKIVYAILQRLFGQKQGVQPIVKVIREIVREPIVIREPVPSIPRMPRVYPKDDEWKPRGWDYIRPVWVDKDHIHRKKFLQAVEDDAKRFSGTKFGHQYTVRSDTGSTKKRYYAVKK